MNILTLAIVLVGIGTLIATNRSHQRQLRAYIHPVGKVTIEGLDTLNDITKFFPENWEGDVAKKPPSKVGEKKITYRIVFKNFGQTPAHGIMMEGKLFVANFPLALNHRAQLPKLYSRKELETDSKGLQDVLLDGSLGPNGEIGLEVNLPSLTENEILNLTLGRNSAIYFYGRVEYRDAFNADRQTNFMLVHYKDSRQDLYKDTFSTWINGNKAT